MRIRENTLMNNKLVVCITLTSESVAILCILISSYPKQVVCVAAMTHINEVCPNTYSKVVTCGSGIISLVETLS